MDEEREKNTHTINIAGEMIEESTVSNKVNQFYVLMIFFLFWIATWSIFCGGKKLSFWLFAWSVLILVPLL